MIRVRYTYPPALPRQPVERDFRTITSARNFVRGWIGPNFSRTALAIVSRDGGRVTLLSAPPNIGLADLVHTKAELADMARRMT